MVTLHKDLYAIGLSPIWEDMLIEFIDIELGLATTPRRRWIIGYLLDGHSLRSISRELGMHHKQVQREIEKIKHDWEKTRP